MERPFVFGVDLDGVVADYTAGFRHVVAEELGVALRLAARGALLGLP
ncbi:MAG: hypothetical protein R2695_14985 [Acidimicrobiales bacterium]